MEPLPRRQRMEIGYAPRAAAADPNRRRRAIAIAAKLRAKYPYRDYGRSYTRRGSAESLQIFGPTFREANAEQKAMRRRYGYIGRGMYSAKDLRSDYETLMGKRVSRAISRKLAGAISSLPFSGSGLYSGRGSYTNNLIANGTGSVPIVKGSGDETGAITISHTEYICDIFGPGAVGGPAVPFENLSFNLNPGLESTFPWLAQLAQNFEEYEFNQLIFHYTSTITDIGSSTSGQCGTLTMATDYNAAHKPFSDKSEMLGYAHSYSCKATESMDHGVECDPNKNAGSKANYIRTNPLSSTEDIKTYDHGIFQLAISNVPSTLQAQSLGELRVTYSVTLRKPKLFTARGLGISRDFFVTMSSGQQNPGSRLISQGAKVYSGVNNNINTKIEGGLDGFKILFPDYFTGHVRIMVIIKLLTTAGNVNFTLPNPTTQGNVTPINEIYGQDGQPTYLFKSSTIPVNTGGGEDMCIVAHYFIRASTGGTDNWINILGCQDATGYVQTFVNVEEYNSYDKTDAASLNNVIDPATGIVVAGNAI